MELCNKKPSTFLMSSSGRSVMDGDSCDAINASKNKNTVEPTDVALIVFMVKVEVAELGSSVAGLCSPSEIEVSFVNVI
ncbi:hypothetical protein CRYUN_Cryun26dG0020400 [Craigia yunnanensis]